MNIRIQVMWRGTERPVPPSWTAKQSKLNRAFDEGCSFPIPARKSRSHQVNTITPARVAAEGKNEVLSCQKFL